MNAMKSRTLRNGRRVAVIFAGGVGMVLAACGSTALSTPQSSSSSTNPSTPSASLPATPLTAPIASNGGNGAPYDPVKLGVTIGTVEADWYQSHGFWVVAYVGLDLSKSGPVCPGNSIKTATGFQNVTNSPTGAGACAGFTRIAVAPAGVLRCGGKLLYVTPIPASAQGTLYASFARNLPDGQGIGIFGTVPSTKGTPPQIDLNALGCAPLG